MASTAAGLRHRPPTITRLGVSVTAGVITAALTIVLGDWRYAPAVGWDAAAIVFSGWMR